MAPIVTNYPAGTARTKAFAVFGAFGGLGAIIEISLAGGIDCQYRVGMDISGFCDCSFPALGVELFCDTWRFEG